MQPVYRIKIHFALLVSLLITVSCDKDDVTPPDNHIVLAGKKYEINDAIIRYLGTSDLTNDNQEADTHYLYYLYFSDGDITSTSGPSTTNASYLISAAFCVPTKDNSIEFTGGTFNSLDPMDYFGGRVPTDKTFFSTFFIRIDTNGNHDFTKSDNDIFTDGSDGQITISGTEPQFKITFNNKIVDDNLPATPITGSYEGTFEVIRQ